MHSLSNKYLNSLAFNSEQAGILRLIGEYRGKQALFFKQSPETLETLRMVAKIESSESSNRLEGIDEGVIKSIGKGRGSLWQRFL